MKILLLGGTGAIGISLARILSTDQCNAIYVTSRKERADNERGFYYIKGNAKDLDFLYPLLENEKYDVIVDFMLYTVDEFKERIKKVLSCTGHYFFLSSSRVYAETEELITESSPRLLDVTNDQEYINDFEYSLYKATEEDILKDCMYKNWTIIRPYKTYSDERLQLGVFEQEQWIDRALRGKKVLFLKDSLSKYTSLTYAYDTAKVLKQIIYFSKSSMRKVFNIANPEKKTWKDIIAIYNQALEEDGIKLRIVLTEDYDSLSRIMNNRFRIKYDGLVNRQFSDDTVQTMFGSFHWMPVETGLVECTKSYIRKYGKHPKKIDYSTEGFFDRMTGEREPLFSIAGIKNKLRYVLYRYFPLWVVLRVKKG